MKTCSIPDCQNLVEGRTDMCASHGHQFRKFNRMANNVKVVMPVKKITAKHAKELQDYGVLRRIYLQEHPECEVRIKNVCDGMSTDVHHKASRGKNLLDAETFIAACRSCHIHIHDVMSAEERREKGLLITKDEIV